LIIWLMPRNEHGILKLQEFDYYYNCYEESADQSQRKMDVVCPGGGQSEYGDIAFACIHCLGRVYVAYFQIAPERPAAKKYEIGKIIILA
jgi:hypothetical protein